MRTHSKHIKINRGKNPLIACAWFWLMHKGKAASNRKLYLSWKKKFFQSWPQITLEQFKEAGVCKSSRWANGRLTQQRYTSVVWGACYPGSPCPLGRTMIKEQRPKGRSGLNDDCHPVPLTWLTALETRVFWYRDGSHSWSVLVNRLRSPKLQLCLRNKMFFPAISDKPG